MFLQAGFIVVMVALIQMPETIGISYDQSALAAGDGRNYFWLQALKAFVQTVAFLIGITRGGLEGALLAQAVALLALHPAVILLARKHRAWDPVNDIVLFGLAAALVALAFWVNADMLGML